MDEGFTVSGSDAHRSELTDNLEARGAKVYIGQKAENIQDGIDVVVYTAAIHPDNPEFQEVKRRGIPMLTRAELLGEMMRNYKNAIAIAGTHGKTTTTSMVTEIFFAGEKMTRRSRSAASFRRSAVTSASADRNFRDGGV